MQVICGRNPNCGFRVHDQYYVQKKRFTPGICARCNGPIKIVRDNTDTAISGQAMVLAGSDAGRIMASAAAAAASEAEV